MKIYIAGPMSGYPEFNFPAFRHLSRHLRNLGHYVFSPAERDEERHGTDIGKGNPDGSVAVAAATHGFNLREALADDCEFICKTADCIAMLPGWEKSLGARAEHALAVALGLEIMYFAEDEF